MATESSIGGRGYALRLRFSLMLPEHLEQVLAIERESFPIPWSRQAFMFEVEENDLAFYIVALANKRVVGYAGMWAVLDEAHITNVAVHPDFRGRGVGRALIMELLARAAVSGAAMVTLEVRVSNHIARNLYRSAGFADRGLRRGYYSDNGEDALIMGLKLYPANGDGSGGPRFPANRPFIHFFGRDGF